MPSYKLFSTRTAGNAGYLLEGVAVSGGAGSYFRSTKFRGSPQGLLSFTLRWTGTPTGVFTLWYSDKDSPDPASETDWKQDTTWSPTNPAGAAGEASYQISGISKRWVKVRYENTAGSGNVFGEQGA